MGQMVWALLYENNGTISTKGGYIEFEVYKDGGTVSVDSNLQPIVSITSSNPSVFPEQDVTLSEILYTPTNIGGFSQNIGFYFAEPSFVPAGGQAIPGTYTVTMNAPEFNISHQLTVTIAQDPNVIPPPAVNPNVAIEQNIIQEVKAKYPTEFMAANTMSNGQTGWQFFTSSQDATSGTGTPVAELWMVNGVATLHWLDGTPNN